MSSLWEQQRARNRAEAEPLPTRMRPRRLEEFIGQAHLLGAGRLLRRLIEADRLTSAIFFGPPGTGKTTLARLIAGHTNRAFEQLHAAEAGVKQIREVLDGARERLADERRGTILFLDEIHRFNRAQQDVLLADVERGTVALIGATTMNPLFSVNSPLVSRSQLFGFHPLTESEVRTVLEQALSDPERGLGALDVRVTDEALDHWAAVSDGDARRALLALEIAVRSGGREDAGAEAIHIDRDVAEESIQQKAVPHDAAGDEHYDLASAFIKSMRGSDPDAAVYWLARMLEAGEDPLFIARRIAIFASEDVGNADPQAISVADAAHQLTERVGLPECELTLAQAATFMAAAPKSKASAHAIWQAREDVRAGRTVPVPRHLRDSHYPGAERLGAGTGYRDPHADPRGYVEQDYLGVERSYYAPVPRGAEKRLRARLEALRAGEDPERSGAE